MISKTKNTEVKTRVTGGCMVNYLYLRHNPCRSPVVDNYGCSFLHLFVRGRVSGGSPRTSWKKETKQGVSSFTCVHTQFSQSSRHTVRQTRSSDQYQCDWQVLWQAGHRSQWSPECLTSSHTHLPHTHFPSPLHIKPLADWQFALESGQLQVSPVQPSSHTHSLDTHTPLPGGDTQRGVQNG